ncbi:MAG: hypothetical protein ACRDNE_05840 [Gaiellaceae bacterium]
MVWDWLVIVAGFGSAALFLRLLGGFASAGDAIAGWGRRSSLRRISRLRALPPSFRDQRRTSSS